MQQQEEARKEEEEKVTVDTVDSVNYVKLGNTILLSIDTGDKRVRILNPSVIIRYIFTCKKDLHVYKNYKAVEIVQLPVNRMDRF